MSRITDFFTLLMRRYLPDPFVFAILLTLVAIALAVTVQGQSLDFVITGWGKGFWSLLAFTTQMAVILAMGYVLATAPLTNRLLDSIVQRVSTPRTAVALATLIACIASYLNWGFGLIIGGVIAKKLAANVKGVHYPLIIASAFGGWTLYGLGLSASIPVLISTKGHPMEAEMGVIPLSETIFSGWMLATALIVLVTLPLLCAWLHPRPGDKVIEYDARLDTPDSDETGAYPEDTGAISYKLNHSRVLSGLISLCGLSYVAMHFLRGGALDLNVINLIILFLGVAMLRTPAAYVERLNEGVKMIGGIILQYPFYAGIMAIMAASGLVNTVSALFVDFATSSSLPVWGLISSFFINFFAPSGGGHWIIQGPFMIEAAKTLHSSMPLTAMSVMLGNAWNDLIQPFWLLPVLAMSKLKISDIMGYTVVMAIWTGVIYFVVLVLAGGM